MAKQRQSVQKRIREQKKREREQRKRDKAAQKRERKEGGKAGPGDGAEGEDGQ